MRILAIDPALRNGGCCLFDTEALDGENILHLERIDLLKPREFKRELRMDPHRLPQFVQLWVQRHEELFATVDFCAVETQTGAQATQLSQCFASALLFFAPTMMIAPAAVRKHFGTGGGSVDATKLRTMVWCRTNLSSYNYRLLGAIGGSKPDELADATMLCLYAGVHCDQLLRDFRNPRPAPERTTRTPAPTNPRPRTKQRFV